jgi:Fe-S cluster assembly iron-binding protein IscA
VKITAKAKKEFKKLAGKGRSTKDSIRITIIRNCCLENVIFEPAGKKKGDTLVLENGLKIYAAPGSYNELSEADIDYKDGNFVVKTAVLNDSCGI